MISSQCFIYVIFVLLNFITRNGLFVTSSGVNIYDSVTTHDIIAGDVFFEILNIRELEYTYRLRPAKDFGATFNSSLKLKNVRLVPTIPSDGCTPIRNQKSMQGNVALMQRGECSFLSKTINAEKAGALAAIITEYNPNQNDFEYYIEMVHDNTARDTYIPAGFLLGKSGRAIRDTLTKFKKSYAIINFPVNLTFIPPQQINHPPWLIW